jgi:hypothetical protein
MLAKHLPADTELLGGVRIHLHLVACLKSGIFSHKTQMELKHANKKKIQRKVEEAIWHCKIHLLTLILVHKVGNLSVYGIA